MAVLAVSDLVLTFRLGKAHVLVFSRFLLRRYVRGGKRYVFDG